MPLISAQTIFSALPRCPDVNVWASALDGAFRRYQINTPDRISSFLAQTGYESEQFTRLKENLNYSTPQRLARVWPKRFPDLEIAATYVNSPSKLGNYVYANRLGNGDQASGDGFKYIGRGIIQLTGKSNYAQASKELEVDLVTQPDLLLQPVNAALAAAWFWSSRGLNALADDRTDDNDLEDFSEITRRINGGTIGLQARLDLFNLVKRNIQ